ncbi:MAG: YeeE/YedE family protein [Betaproteobacteria bacterium]|jgi:uncharacterized protein|nr:YeeE/YedE family protein [Betaproteobacteria bacterium]NBP45376.1 YeeE/YedE family protein [Betaproteobacteria bacterium]
MRRRYLALVGLTLFVFLVGWVSVRQAALWLIGLGMGAVLAGARFGFTTGWRHLIQHKDPSGITGQAVLLALAALLAMPLLAQFSELHAALGPPSISLLVGAFVFGLTMQIADGCGSGTLYKAGLGIPLNVGLLPLFALGSFLGSVHLDRWLSLGQIEPVSLPQTWGTVPALLITWAALGVLLLLARLWVGAGRTWLRARWLWGAVALAVLATLNLLVAGQPWGVVYGFGLWVAKLAVAAQLFDPAANAFWSQPGNLQLLGQNALLDVTTITNLGILTGALWIAQAPKASAQPKPLTRQQWVVGLVAGLLLGYSSRLAFGCNVGAMLSGISTGSLHGWIWVFMAFAGSLVGVRVRRHYGFGA